MAPLPSVRASLGVVQVPLRVGAGIVRRVDRVLSTVENLATGVVSMEKELRAMRRDMREVVDGVDRLGDEVRGMRTGVDGIRGSTESLDGRLDGVAGSLERIDHLAGRLGRFGGGRARRGPDG
jgi:hypothetical protein